jgi:hypothetical protein
MVTNKEDTISPSNSSKEKVALDMAIYIKKYVGKTSQYDDEKEFLMLVARCMGALSPGSDYYEQAKFEHKFW